MKSGRVFGRALLCCAALSAAFSLLAASSAKAAVATQAEESYFESLPETMKLKALYNLARTGRHELAADLLERHPLTGPYAENRTLFIEGLIAKARGDLQGAADKFRAALANDPKLTLVRAELSMVLHMMGEDDSAKHHLELLMGAAPTAKDARDIRSFIDSIDAARPFRMSAYVSLAPSTNINRGTTNNEILPGFEIDDEGRKKSGIGITAGVNVGYTKHLADRLDAVVGGGVHAVQYQDDDFDQVLFSETAELRQLLDTGYVGFGAVAAQSLGGKFADLTSFNDFSGEISTTSFGPRISFLNRFTPTLAYNGSLMLLRQDFEEEYRDGWRLNLDGQLTRTFATDLTGYVSGGIERGLTDDRKDLEYWAFYGGVGVYKELRWGISTTAEVEARYEHYDDIFSAWVPENREDWQIDTTINLWKRDWNFYGYSPAIEYRYTWNDSNIAFYEYDSHTVDIRLTKDF
ncbi:MAG: surface lipoprotein assembly modifier [Parvibaculaceae bacterium]